MALRWQYPIKVEPVPPAPGDQVNPVIAEPNWHQPFHNTDRNMAARRAALGLVAVLGGAFFVNPHVETIEADKWFQSWAERVDKSAPALKSSHPFEGVAYTAYPGNFVEAVQEEPKWHQPLSEPLVKRRVLLGAAHQVTAYTALTPIPDVQADKWFAQWAEQRDKVKPRPTTHQVLAWTALRSDCIFEWGIFDEGVFQVCANIGWHSPFSEPVRAKPGPLYYDSGLPYTPPAAETINADKWHVPFADRTLRKPFQTGGAAYVALTPIPDVQADKWFVSLSERPDKQRPALRVGSNQHLAYGATPITDVSTDLKWYQSFTEPLTKRWPLGRGAYQHFTYTYAPTTFVETAWFQPLSERPNKARPALRTGQNQSLAYTALTPIPDIQADKWFSALSERPDKRARRLWGSNQYLAHVYAPGTFVETAWFQALSERPDKAAPRLRAGSNQHLAYTYAPTTFVETAWFQALSERPDKRRPALRSGAHQSLAYTLTPSTFVEAVTSYASWHQALSEPARVRSLLTAARQNSNMWSSHTPASAEEITVDKYFVHFGEPLVKKLTLKSAHQVLAYTHTPSTFVETATSVASWYRPFADVVRRKAIQEQQQTFIAAQPVPSGWLAAQAEPQRLRAVINMQSAVWGVFTPAAAETVTVDKWFALFKEVARRAVSHATYEALAFAFGAEIPAAPTVVSPEAAPEAAPDNGFDRYMEEFARSRLLERQLRENDELMLIAAFEDEIITAILKKLV